MSARRDELAAAFHEPCKCGHPQPNDYFNADAALAAAESPEAPSGGDR